MPQIQTKNCPSDPNTQIAFWHITETEDELLRLLPKEKRYKERVGEVSKNPKRRKEWLAVRVLLHQTLGPEVDIDYKSSGSPFLRIETENSPTKRAEHKEETPYISISHSHGYVALAVSSAPIGIDIEIWGPRALRLVSHFLTSEERSILSDDAERKAVVLWSVKETTYKYFDIAHLSLYDDIRIMALSDSEFSASLPKYEKEVSIRAEYLDHFVLTYTTTYHTRS